MERIKNKAQLDGIVIANGSASELTGIANGSASDQPAAGQPKQSFLSFDKANGFLEEGKKMEPARELVPHVMVEHETTILFGDTGLGKSTFAMQVANEIALQGKRVQIVNFELAKQQMAQRYKDKEFSDNLFVSTVDYALMHDVTDQANILAEIERMAVENDIDVLVIDNLTNLCVNSKEGGEAGNIMLRLLGLRMQHQWTILVLAHVPKRKPGDPLTLNDLAGSKLISNFADNVVGINKSKKDKNMRYLIQLKYRSLPIELDYKNVQELMLTTSDGWLHFEYGGYGEEISHLPRSRDEKEELEREILKELRESNPLSYRDIAEKLVTTLGKVQRTAKKYGIKRKE